MEIQSRPTTVRTVTAAALVATIAFTLLAATAEANRARRAVVGGTIGAGVGALVDGGSGARTGTASSLLAPFRADHVDTLITRSDTNEAFEAF